METGTKLARAKLLNELNDLRVDLWNKQRRLKRLQAHRALPGSEHIAEDARKRYAAEIAELQGRIDLLEANLEGLAEPGRAACSPAEPPRSTDRAERQAVPTNLEGMST